MLHDHPVVKAGSAWVFVGITKVLAMIGVASWSDAASMGSAISACLASLYTLVLLFDHFRKKHRLKRYADSMKGPL